MDNLTSVIFYILGIISGIIIFQYCIRKGVLMTYEIQEDLPKEKISNSEIPENYIGSEEEQMV